MLRVYTVRDVAQFSLLRDEWNSLLAKSTSNNLFLTWEWVYTWWKSLSGNRRLHIVLVRDDDQLVAVAPLTLRTRCWKRAIPLKALEFIGAGDVGSDYLDVIIRFGYEQCAYGALSDHLSRSGYMFELNRIKKNDAHIVKLGSEITSRGWTCYRKDIDESPYIDLCGHDWGSYLATLSSAHRYNVRRRIKKLEKAGIVHFECATNNDQRQKALRTLIDLHNQRWVDRGYPGAFHSESLIEFHEQFSHLALEREWLRLYVLKLNGVAVAALYGFLYDGRFYFYQSGFNSNYSQYSVGLVAMALAIKTAIKEEAAVYDFLHGNESYKYLWTKRQKKLQKVEFYPPGARGRIYRNTMQIRNYMKKTKHILPKPILEKMGVAP